MNNLIGERDGLRVVFDDRRGYARLDPLPSQAEIDRLYAGSFWAAKGNEQAVRRMQAAWWDLHYGDWLELAREVAEIKLRYSLDVGCGFGYFLRACLRDGLSVAGVDVNPDALSEARQVLADAGATLTGRFDFPPDTMGPDAIDDAWGALNMNTWRIRRATIHSAPAVGPYLPYDLISALWVMEHLAEPEAFLDGVYNRLETGGVFIAAVPSDFNALQLRVVDEGLSARPYWWIDPTHLNYWTPATFANLLGRHGFRVAALTTMYPMERFIVSGYDYPTDQTIGATLHTDVRDFDRLMKTREARIDFYRHLALGGQGREIVAICIKE